MRSLLPWILIVVLGALAYVNGLDGEFLYDDTVYVSGNPQVQEGGLAEAFGQPLGSSHQGLYRPLAVLTYQWQAGGRGAAAPTWPFHVLNVALHAVVSLLVVAFALQIGLRRGVALLSGALFAVHPVHVEAVTWIVGRAELIAAALGLSCFLAMRRLGPWAAAPLWLLACLGKEGALVWPGILFVDEWWRARSRTASEPAGRRPWWPALAMRFLPFVLAFAGLVALRYAVLGRFGPDVQVAPYRDLSPGSRVLLPFNLLGAYLRMSVLPWPSRLFYHFTEFVTARPVDLLIVGAGLVGVWRARRHPTVRLLAIGFVLSLVPFLALRPIQETFAERFLYLPTAFVCPLMAMALWAVLDRERRRRGRIGISIALPATVVLAGLAGCWALNGRYRDALTLWEATARVAPDLPFPHYQLAYFQQAGEIYTPRDHWRGAVAEYVTALELHEQLLAAGGRGMPPDQEARAHLNVGMILHRLLPRGQRNIPRAEQHLRRAEQIGREIQQLDEEWARALYELSLLRHESTTVTAEEAELALRQAEQLQISDTLRERIGEELERVRAERAETDHR